MDKKCKYTTFWIGVKDKYKLSDETIEIIIIMAVVYSTYNGLILRAENSKRY
jgi:hypothetical protein